MKIANLMSRVGTLAKGLQCAPVLRPREDGSLRVEEVNLFNEIGHFMDDMTSREYCLARCQLVDALLKMKSRTALTHASEHLMDLVYLNRGDAFTIERLPSTLVLIDRIQDAYDFFKYWRVSFGQDRSDACYEVLQCCASVLQQSPTTTTTPPGGIPAPVDHFRESDFFRPLLQSPPGNATDDDKATIEDDGYLELRGQDVSEDVELLNFDEEYLEAHRVMDLALIKIAALRVARRFAVLRRARILDDVLRRVAEFDGFEPAVAMDPGKIQRQLDQLFSLVAAAYPTLLPNFLAKITGGKQERRPPVDEDVKLASRGQREACGYVIESRCWAWKQVNAGPEIRDFLDRGVAIPVKRNDRRDAATAAMMAKVHLQSTDIRNAVTYLREHHHDDNVKNLTASLHLTDAVAFLTNIPTPNDTAPLCWPHRRGIAMVLQKLDAKNINDPHHRAIFFGDGAKTNDFTNLVAGLMDISLEQNMFSTMFPPTTT